MYQKCHIIVFQNTPLSVRLLNASKMVFGDGEEHEDGDDGIEDKRKVQKHLNRLIIIEIVMQIGFHTTAQCSARWPSLAPSPATTPNVQIGVHGVSQLR